MGPLPQLQCASPPGKSMASTPTSRLSEAGLGLTGKLPSIASPIVLNKPQLAVDIELACDTLTWADPASTPLRGQHGSITPLHSQAQTAAILGSFKFFQEMDLGVQAKLPDLVTVMSKRKGTVLFRQGDPPGNCYVVLHGEVGIFVRSADSDETDENGTPRSGADARKSMSNAQGAAEGRQSVWDSLPGCRTVEGFSSYHEESNLGNQIGGLGPGSLLGELALLNDQPRSASVKCLSETEFLVIRRCDFDNVLKEEMVKKGDEKLRFLMMHVPGMRDVAVPKPGPGTKPHASYFFRKGKYDRGHQFLQEGIATESTIFVLFTGSVEFRRSERAQPATALPKVASMPSLSPSAKLSKNRQALTGNGTRSGSNSKLRTLVKEEDSDEVVNRLGVLLPGGVFGSLPISAKEPFTVTVTSPTCEVFFCSGIDVTKLPRKLLDTVREYLAHTTAWRLQCHHRSQDFRRRRQVVKGHRKKEKADVH